MKKKIGNWVVYFTLTKNQIILFLIRFSIPFSENLTIGWPIHCRVDPIEPGSNSESISRISWIICSPIPISNDIITDYLLYGWSRWFILLLPYLSRHNRRNLRKTEIVCKTTLIFRRNWINLKRVSTEDRLISLSSPTQSIWQT